MNLEDFTMQNGVHIAEAIVADTHFEKLYSTVRSKEQRIYCNDDLINLPEIDTRHQHYKEWLVRKVSCRNLIKYLEKKDKFLKILEVGCGNGWLSNKLSKIPQTEIVGVDINLTELQQAASAFTNKNLQFIYGDIRQNIFKKTQFDIIVFSASIPYFSALNEIIEISLQHLRLNGEIHIIDTLFYNKDDIPAAKQRCKEYYECIGIPEMANYFFHYSLNDLCDFNCVIMWHKSWLLKRLFFRRNLFPWLCIRHF